MFEIRKNLPIPAATRSSRDGKYPWKEMAIGDSFVIPCNTEDAAAVKKVKASVYSSAKNAKVKVRCSLEEGGVGIWKTGVKTAAVEVDAPDADAPDADDEGDDDEGDDEGDDE